MRNTLMTTLLAVAVLWLSTVALAQEVFQQARQRTGWVGRPLIVQYVYTDVEDAQPPSIPAVDGLSFAVQPKSSSTQTQIINGRRSTRNETIWPVAVTADRPGTFVLPAFDLQAAGQSWRTQAVELTFRPVDDASTMQAAAVAAADHSWLGDVVPAVLEIQVRPFRHDLLPNGKLSMADTWRFVDQGTADWGPYATTIEHYRSTRGMPFTSTRTAADGTVDWYVFQVPTMLRPDRAGPVDMGDITVGIEYPVELGQDRDPFAGFFGRGGLRIVQSRPVKARPDPVIVDVRTPPAQDRPADYTGAVGRFAFDVTATPDVVDVGQPITLQMTVNDRSERLADLDTLSAPALHRVEELTGDFKIPEDRPGGIVSGRTKRFTQSIRPTHAGIDVIPPVPFSFFNPDTASYETVLSPPIPITVREGKTLTATDLPGLPDDAGTQTTDGLTAVHGGLLANITDTQQLLRTPARPDTSLLLAVLALPPVAFVGALAMRRRQQGDGADPARGRARRAARAASAALQDAGDDGAAVAEALRGLVMDRLGLPEGHATGELVAALSQLDTGTADAFASLVSTLDALTFGGSGGKATPAQLEAARTLMTRVMEATR